MSATTRKWARRELDRSRNNLEWSLSHLEKVREKYQEPHPDIGNALTAIQQLIVSADGLIKGLKHSF